MGLVSKPKLEGLGLDDQFLFTVHGTRQKRVSLSSFKKKQFIIKVPNQPCCLTSQPYNDFPHIFMLVLFFLLMARIIGFFKPFCLISFPRSLIQRFDLSGRGAFLLSYSRYLDKIHVSTSSTLVLILRFDKTSISFPFFAVFFLFVDLF